MFGYIRPFKPDLRIREWDTYKAVYCGLCGQLGKSFGPVARLTLSYDFVFLCVLHYAVSSQRPVFEAGRCHVNPMRKLTVCIPDETLAFGADMASLMLYYKALDNMQDGGALRKIVWSAARPFAGGARKKAAARQPFCDESIAACMAGQAKLEKDGCSSIDAACEPTAGAMSAIFGQMGGGDPATRRILERTGYLLGRYVYLCDALDDLPGDLKSGSYNPFALRYGLTTASDEAALRDVCKKARDALYMTAGEAAKAYQLLEPGVFGSILDNVFYQGLRACVDEILLRRMPKPGLEPDSEPGAAGDCEGCVYRADRESGSIKERKP